MRLVVDAWIYLHIMVGHSIYCIRNTLNGKTYIGQTSVSPAKRWTQHKCHTGRNTRIAHAMRKHGPAAFTFKVLHTGLTKEEADDLETLWIIVMQSRRRGYNSAPGGTAHSEETKAKIGAANRGRKHSPERVQIARERARGNTNNRGRKQSPETIRKRSEALRGRKIDPEVVARRAATKRRNNLARLSGVECSGLEPK